MATNNESVIVEGYLPGLTAFRSTNATQDGDGWTVCSEPNYRTPALDPSHAKRAARNLKRCGYVVRMRAIAAQAVRP